MHSAFRNESDRRIALILQIKSEFDNIMDVDQDEEEEDVEEMVAKADLLVSLYEQERLSGSMEDAYRIAALSYAKSRKGWQAMKWAMKATEAHLFTELSRERVVGEMAELNDRLRAT